MILRVYVCFAFKLQKLFYSWFKLTNKNAKINLEQFENKCDTSANKNKKDMHLFLYLVVLYKIYNEIYNECTISMKITLLLLVQI